MARRAFIPRLDELPTGDVPYAGGPPPRGPAELPHEFDAATAALGQLSTIDEKIGHIHARLARLEAADEAETNAKAASATSVVLADWRRNRSGLFIFNDGTTTLRVKFGAGAATDSFSFKLQPGQWYEMPKPVYRGIVTGIWDGAPTGNAMVTELV